MLVRSVYWTNVSPSLKNLKIIRYESIKRGKEKYSLFYVSLCFIFWVNFCYCEKFQLILPQFPPPSPPPALSRTTYPQVSRMRINFKVNWDEVPSWNLQIPDSSFIYFHWAETSACRSKSTQTMSFFSVQVSLQSMLSGSAAGSFADDIMKWQKRLQTIEAVLTVWLEVQEKWIELEDVSLLWLVKIYDR